MTYALYWTNTCCSHQTTADNPSDSKKDAIVRLKGEVGIDLNRLKSLTNPMESLTLLSKVIYKDRSDEIWGEYELDYIYFVKQRDILHISQIAVNSDEVEALQWLKREDAQDFVRRTDIKITPWFRRIVKQADFFTWWAALEKGELSRYAEQNQIQQLADD